MVWPVTLPAGQATSLAKRRSICSRLNDDAVPAAAGIASLQKMGSTFLLCNNALGILVSQLAEGTKGDAAAIKDATAPANGLFASLTNRIVEAWSRAGSHDIDGALAALDALSSQRGVDGLRLMHKALILEYAGKDKEADDAYKAAMAVMGTGPRGTEAYGRFLLRHNRADDAKALYQRAAKENPGTSPIGDR